MEKIFEISSQSINIKNLSYEQFRDIFMNERINIVNYLKKNFNNPERISYLNYKIDYGKMGHPYGQTLYLNGEEGQYFKAYNLLKESENWNKTIGYKIYIKEGSYNENKSKELSGIAFGHIDFLFDEDTTKELQEKDRKLHEDVMKFYANSRSNFRGD